MADEREIQKVGLENIDDETLALIIDAELRENDKLEQGSSGDIAFQELARRSGK